MHFESVFWWYSFKKSNFMAEDNMAAYFHSVAVKPGIIILIH